MDMTERLHFHFSVSFIGEGNGNPLQCSCLENPRDGGAWWAAVYGVPQSWTRLKRLSSSSDGMYDDLIYYEVYECNCGSTSPRLGRRGGGEQRSRLGRGGHTASTLLPVALETTRYTSPWFAVPHSWSRGLDPPSPRLSWRPPNSQSQGKFPHPVPHPSSLPPSHHLAS